MRHAAVVLVALLVAGAVHGQAPQEIHPLEPPDTFSPRGTIGTFLDSFNQAWELFDAGDPRFREHFAIAKQCIDVSEVPPNVVDSATQDGTLLLKEVLDRIEVPPLAAIPGSEEVADLGLTRWTIPHTEIELIRVKEGPREGEFLFSPETVDRSQEYYERVRDLPYRPGKSGAHYDELRFSVKSRFLARVVSALPAWAKHEYKGQLIWQWVILGGLVLVSALLVGLSILVGRRLGESDRSVAAFLGPMVPPFVLIALQWVIPPLAPWPVKLGGAGVRAIGLCFQAAAYIGVAWLSVVLINKIALLVIHVSAASERPLHQQLILVCARMLSLAVMALVFFLGGQELGIPMSALVTGLGVGGLAVALSAQSTLENLIGGINLFADRPVKIGEFCRFGNELGIVEAIGLRSTRIRTLGRSLVSIPNSSFAKMELENFTRRDRMRLRTLLRLEYGTGPSEVEAMLESLREMFVADERVAEEPRRVRLVDIGGDSLQVEINVYVLTTDWDEFLAIREELYLRVMRIIDGLGLRLVPPTERREVIEALAPDVSDD